MSEAERTDRLTRPVTDADILALVNSCTPHFAQQIRGRIARLIDGLPAGDPVRALGEREIERLTALGYTGEHRGQTAEPDLTPLPSIGGGPPARE